MSSLTIGQLAQAAGVGVETIRFYERNGLLKKPPRRPSGYREYSETVIRRLRFIRRAKELGFTLREIQELFDLRAGTAHQCGEVREKLAQKIEDVKARISDLERMKAALEEFHDTCDAIDPAAECPILDALEKAGLDHGSPS